MVKVGILTCANATQDSDCSSFMCLRTLNEGRGPFAEYASRGGVQLAGIISCAGCPTAVAPEKLLRRVRSLANLGVEAIHLSSCIMALCPFKAKYGHVLKEHFPDLIVVEGTHDDSGEGVLEWFRGTMKVMLTQERSSMANLAKASSQEEPD